MSCFRGQSYCGEVCRERARRDQHNEANRKYQRTPEGAENHRRRQREYRERLRLGVTDQTTGASAGVCSSVSQQEPRHGHEETHDDRGNAAGPDNGWAFCVVCGRAGRFMEGDLSPGRWSLP